MPVLAALHLLKSELNMLDIIENSSKATISTTEETKIISLFQLPCLSGFPLELCSNVSQLAYDYAYECHFGAFDLSFVIKYVIYMCEFCFHNFNKAID
jgi:hypothetical protein